MAQKALFNGKLKSFLKKVEAIYLMAVMEFFNDE